MPVIYTNRGVPERFAGYTIGPIVLIRPKYRGDRGLLEHERAHVRQFWRSFGLMPLLYQFSQKYRFRAEVEAYCAQLQHNPENVLRYARFIVDKYGLDVDVHRAYTTLLEARESRCR